MRKVLLAGAFALVALAAIPGQSHAWGRDAYNSHGYGWLGSFAFRHMSWIHQRGPLYNYGPYDGPGHQMMNVKIPLHGVYIPADPTIGYRYGAGYGYPQYGYGGYAPAAPAVAPAPAPGAHGAHGRMMPTQPAPVVPANYNVYPAWLNYR